ncbi:MAG TPA: DEAD/DEAH box helicase [Pseudonocardia sp.]|jgi:superfamily II DNA/RNA helicase|nr:DEAD/DEAH box helicase [Pseudonocardia sp.]
MSTGEGLEPTSESNPESALEPTPEPLHAAAPVKPDAPTFAELGVRPEIVRALNEVGIERTFAIQELTLPLALAGEDVIGQARTGTGKTLGFGVPLLQRLRPATENAADHDVPQALVVVPTRELCVQVARDLADAGRHLKARVTAIYGGRPYEPQVAELQRGVDIVVGTPGRLLDLAEQRHLVLGRISSLVLDEADEMLDLGFLPDVERILRMLPEQRQTMLFSATMPGPIITLSRTFLTQPTHIRAEEADASAIHERTRQFIYRAHALDKVELLSKTLQAQDRGLTMVFTRTKRTAQRVADDLADRGFAVAPVHGDLGQGAREQALRAFRAGKVDVLVATDVAARGIDVTDVTHVVNYQCPEDSKTYIHRIGRTGRAGKEGVAITLVDWDDVPRWKLISDDLGLGVDEPVETYSTSEHLFADLGIPADATGTLPKAARTREGLDAEHLDDAGERRRRGPASRSGPGGRRSSDSRSGSGRSGSSRSATGRQGSGRSSDRTEDAQGPDNLDTESGPTRTRTPRKRNRRRNGVLVAGGEGTSEGTASDSGSAPSRGSAAGNGSAGNGGAPDNGGAPELGTAGEARRPRRRRRRGGSASSSEQGGADETQDAAAS